MICMHAVKVYNICVQCFYIVYILLNKILRVSLVGTITMESEETREL